MKKRRWYEISAGGLLAALVFYIAVHFFLAFLATRDARRHHHWDWTVVSGSPIAGSDGERVLTHQGSTLERDGVRIVLEAGSTIVLPSGTATTAQELPILESGRMVITGNKPLRIAGKLIYLRDSAKISITPEGLEVLGGLVEIEGQVIGRGRLIYLPRDGVGAGEPIETPVPEPAAPPAPEPPPERPATGQVVDARSGAPIAGARVRATFSLSDDGYPPLPDDGNQVDVTSDASGRFRIPPLRVEDPRPKLHLVAEHPDFLPEALVIDDEADLEGNFPAVTFFLRRALTSRVLFLDPQGQPLAFAAVEVDDRPSDPFLGEDTWEEGQSYRPHRSAIRYSGPDGVLELWQERVTLTLHHPFFHLVDVLPHDVLNDRELERRLPEPADSFHLDLRPPAAGKPLADPRAEVLTGYLEPKAYRIQDRDRVPVSGALIEIALRDLPAVRLTTDSEGAFTFTPRPLAKWEGAVPLSPDNPRVGTLTVLSPLLWKLTFPVSFPARAEILLAPGRQAGWLSFRVRESAGADLPLPLSAEGVRISEDLTLVRRTRDGKAVYEGPLPRSGSELTVFLRGFLPELVRIPTHVPGAPGLDLGEVLLRRGESFDLAATGGTPEIYREARFLIADRDQVDLSQEYRLDRAGRAVVSGLSAGRTYDYAIEGPGIERAAGEALAGRDLFENGLQVPLVPIEEVEIHLAGQVDSLKSEECSSYRVIERYFLGDEGDPHIFRSYPLAPDGLLGSVRNLPHPQRVELFLVGPGHLAARAARDLPAGQAEVDLGRLLPKESCHALFSFVVKGLGKVLPPEGLTLLADDDRNHEIARLGTAGRLLAIDHLLPGRYTLRWGGKGSEQEVYSFLVKRGDQEVTGEIVRRALDREVIELQAVDSEGVPVEGARITSERGDFPAPEAFAGGLYQVEVLTREENRFRVERQGFVPASIVLPVGAVFPDPITLLHGARVRAEVLDADGRRFEGFVSVSFRDQDAEVDPRQRQPASLTGEGPPQVTGTVAHGEPLEIEVVHGKLESGRFPPGRRLISFRSAASEAKAEGVYALAEKKLNDLGVLTLAETRSISGTVLSPLGEPVGDALVSLVRPGDQYRFPQRDPDPKGILYSAKSDALGRFKIDGLPLDLQRKMVLVAHADGYADGLESPVNLSIDEHVLYLLAGTRLTIDAGIDEPGDWDDYQLRLEYTDRPDDPRATIDLGPLASLTRGGRIYDGITPGVYRVIFALKESHPSFEPRAAAAAAAPGIPAVLRLRVSERLVAGEAFFNGQPLQSGWIILLADPGKPGEVEFARVRRGRFLVPVPVRAETAFAALIPKRSPLPTPDFYRGEALPVEVRDARSGLRRGFISVEYTAYDLVLEIPGDFLARNSGAWVEFPHYTWGLGGYRKEVLREPLERAPFKLSLLPAGHFSLKVSGRGNTRLYPDIELNQDVRLSLGN